jgi:hypothetical protein
MSTDTDYIITIKGKNAALRKAAADYIELLLNPWTPQRDNKKTLIRIDVFRNESNARGLLAPSSLCEDAAKLFPGTDVSFESKNEYGNTEDGQWIEEGSAPKDINTTVATKALERINAEVESLKSRVDWLTPLSEWATSTKTAKETVDLIENALGEAEKAKQEDVAAQEAEAQRANNEIIAGAEALESVTRWSFHPVLAVKIKPVGRVGKSILCQSRQCILDEAKHISEEVWEPLKSTIEDAGVISKASEEGGWIGVAAPILPNSKETERFLESQVHDSPVNSEGARVFIRTNKCVWGVGAQIHKGKDSLLWIHSREIPSEVSCRPNIQKSIRLGKLLEGSVVAEILQENDLSTNYGRQQFGQDISQYIAVNSSQVFLASKNAQQDGPGLGRIYSLSLADGAVTWTSELRFHECSTLVAPDPMTLLAVVKIDKATILVSLHAATGKEKWRGTLRETGQASFQLASSEETAVLLSYESDKAIISWWRIKSGEVFVKKEISEEGVGSRPELVMDGTQVYFGFKNTVKAFSHEGEEAWTSLLSKGDRWDPCKILLTGKGTALISRGQRGLNCVACETGATIWEIQDANTWDGLVGTNDRAYFSTGEAYETRSYLNGSLLWQSNQPQGEDYSRRPAIVTDTVFVGIAKNRETSSEILEWFDVATGAPLGSVGLSTRSDVIMTKEGTLLCTGSFWIGPDQLICLDLKLGSPQGPWPMSRQGEGCAAFLPTVDKSGYKQFIEAWKANENLSPRLARLGLTVADNGNDNAKVLGIIRGHEMVAQAKLWAEPSIGPGKTAPARGRQWRLVIAYGGLELLIKSLSGTKGNGLDEKILENLFGKLSLPTFEPLEPPAIDKSSLKEWIEEEDASDVLDFLKMENGDRRRFDAWLTRQQAVATWGDGVLLAKALRSATAHGALSPTKITEWKLSETLTRLVDNIFRIDEACFEVLGKTL